MGARAFGPVRLGLGLLLGLGAAGCPVLVVDEDPPCDIACGDGTCATPAQVCDGFDDCSDGRDEDHGLCYPPVLQEVLIVDGCDDLRDVRWRVWATERNWVWPSYDSTFVTVGFLFDSFELIECELGEELCFGAESDGISWGVGVDGEVGCQDCCWTCASDLVDLGLLTCQ